VVTSECVKELPGAPWDEFYVASLLEGGYDRVIANGYEYTLREKIHTNRAVQVLSGDV